MNDTGMVLITRTFDAPRELVWAAFTDPQQVAQWWGPEHFHTPVDSVQIDLRPGGRYDLSMIEDASGTDYPVRFEVEEVVERELLLMRSPAQPELGLTEDVTCRIEFSDADGATQVTLSAGPYVGEMRRMSELGWNSQFGKLERLLGGARTAA